MLQKEVLLEIVHAEKPGLDGIRQQISTLCAKYGLEDCELLYLLRQNTDPGIPIEIFCQDLSPLEALVRYLKDHRQMKLSEISRVLERDQSTIWTTYEKSKNKPSLSLPVAAQISIPIKTFSQRRLSILEVTVRHLSQKGLRLKEIAAILKKSISTISTAQYRAKVKSG